MSARVKEVVRSGLVGLGGRGTGLLGTLLDLEGVGARPSATSARSIWRGQHSVARDGSLYPAHAIGPAAWWMDLNRGDRLSYLVSMSAASHGLRAYARRHFGPDHASANLPYALGDLNATLLRTERGRTITLRIPRRCARTTSSCACRAPRASTAARSTRSASKGGARSRTPGRSWKRTGRSTSIPLWRRYGEVAQHYGHRGGDYLELLQFVQAVRYGPAPPIDVYDAAAWSGIGPLSEQSVAGKSIPVDVPDFTRGAWRTHAPVEIPDAWPQPVREHSR